MEKCIYTTDHRDHLEAMLQLQEEAYRTSPTSTLPVACFHSVVKWATGKRLVDYSRPRPLLIRELGDDTGPLVCTFLADLVEVWLPFPGDVNGDEARLAWLQEKSCVQRRAIADRKLAGTPEEIEQARKERWDREIVWAMQAKTNYRFSNLRRIQPLPLPKLTKVDGNEPLSPAYIRSYSICWFPESEIQFIPSLPTG